MLQYVPNILTISRIILVPIILISIYCLPEGVARIVAATLFLIASATDFFDGIIARKYSVYSKLGEILDPIADKLLVCCVILMLLKEGSIHLVPSVIIISRELAVSAIREVLAGKKIDLKVTRLAKIKTGMQMIALFLLILGSEATSINIVDSIGSLLIWTSSFITLYTAILYIKKASEYFSD
jgi:cardiolipin synthase (CMP-forming)